MIFISKVIIKIDVNLDLTTLNSLRLFTSHLGYLPTKVIIPLSPLYGAAPGAVT